MSAPLINEKQAAILATLQKLIGPQTAWEIGREANIGTVLLYPALVKLQEGNVIWRERIYHDRSGKYQWCYGLAGTDRSARSAEPGRQQRTGE